MTFIVWLDFIDESNEPIFTLTEKDSPDNEYLHQTSAVVICGFEAEQIFPHAYKRFNMIVMYEMDLKHLVTDPPIG